MSEPRKQVAETTEVTWQYTDETEKEYLFKIFYRIGENKKGRVRFYEEILTVADERFRKYIEGRDMAMRLMREYDMWFFKSFGYVE